MYAAVQNENYGYAVATHGKYVGVGDPRLLRWTAATASLIQTGSFDVFHYDINTDTHLYLATIYKPFDPTSAILLAAESASIKLGPLHTEVLGFDIVHKDKDLQVDEGLYINHKDNDYGHALDCYNKRFAVGYRYYWDQVVIDGATFDSSGSGVDIWDYSFAEHSIYTSTDPVTIIGEGSVFSGSITSSFGDTSQLNFSAYNTSSNNFNYVLFNVPAGYDDVQVYGALPGSASQALALIPVLPEGQYLTFAYDFGLGLLTINGVGVINAAPVRLMIPNPDPSWAVSFGHAVSLNEDWLAVGSPGVSGSVGMVYLYKNDTTGSTPDYTLYQRIAPSSLFSGQQFGWSVSLNKSTAISSPDRLVVGAGAANNNTVYFFELSGSSWVESYDFHQITSSIYPFPFNSGSYPILLSASYQTSSFGWSVSTWEDTVVIGAPDERVLFEYTGSPGFFEGTAYIFERCSNVPSPAASGSANYALVKKVYGDQFTLKNNMLGYAVSVYGDNMAIGIPKFNVVNTSCFLDLSLFQQTQCAPDLEDTLQGQWAYLTRDTSSMQWEIQKVFQKKKRFLSPYRSFGESVSVGDFSIVVGAPMLISDLTRNFSLNYTESLGVSLDDIMGKAYIYNFKNYKNSFYVGNVFYRNGMVIVNTSGSALSGLFFNPASPYFYEYDLAYQSQHTINEKQVVCTAEPGEFNVSTNPTALIPATSSLDINQNGQFDFQDADIVLRYMQFKNSTTLGFVSFDWSSSLLKYEDEISFYKFNAAQWTNTDLLFSSSLKQFETVDTGFADLLDFNQDSRIDVNDMNILWKYFSHRLTERNYFTYINPNCQRQKVAQAIDYLDGLTLRHALPTILPEFFLYDQHYLNDRTGSFLAPMVTTIGLYDGVDLVAVAKVGSPIKLPRSLPINFVVKMDF